MKFKLGCCVLVCCMCQQVVAGYREEAMVLGQQIDTLRQQTLTIAQINDQLAQIAEFETKVRQHRLEKEAAADENEQALEQLYRSPRWGDIGFALAASRYWRSWLLLDRFRVSKVDDDLLRATRGFRTTLVLIVYPGLVRGSWLGLGYVHLERGELELARTWFSRVNTKEDPLGNTARFELSLLDALEQPVRKKPAVLQLSAERADKLEQEALTLLRRHSTHLDGASRAAQRLLQLEMAGHLNSARTERLMAYRDEIIGHEIGPVGFLVSAENALEHQQYYTAVEKYRLFFAALDEQRREEFARFYPGYVQALLGSGLIAEANQVLQLKALETLQGEIQIGLQQLKLQTAALDYAQQGGQERRAKLAQAARDLTSPAAQYSRSLLSGEYQALEKIAPDAWLEQLPTFGLVYREFNEPANTTSQGQLSRVGLKLHRKLPRSAARQAWVEVARLNFLSVLDTPVKKFLAQLDDTEERLSRSDAAAADTLFATRVQFLERRAPEMLSEVIARTPAPLADHQSAALLQALRGCSAQTWCFDALRGLIEKLQPGSQAALFAHLKLARLLLSRDETAAYAQARQIIERFPQSGDGLLLYAEAAAEVGRLGDADAAYGRLAENLPVGSTEWRQNRLRQLDLRISAGAEDAACRLTPLAYQDGVLLTAIQQRLDAAGIQCLPQTNSSGLG